MTNPVHIVRRPADEILGDVWPTLSVDLDQLLARIPDRVERVAQLGSVMTVGLAIDRLVEEVHRLRLLESTVTSYMLGEVGRTALVRAQQHVRELR